MHDPHPRITIRYLDETHKRVDWNNGHSMVVDNKTADKATEPHLKASWTLGAAA